MDLNGDLQLLGQGEIKNLRIHNLIEDPVAPILGQLWYNTTSAKLKYFDGTVVNILATGESDTTIQNEIDTLEAAVGTNDDGSLPSLATTNYLAGATTLLETITMLDAILKSSTVATSNIVVGQVYVTGVTPTSTGIVGNKTYLPNTVPANSIISEATADTANVRITVMAEGGIAFYNPTVTVDGTVITLTEVANEKRMFTGYADVVVNADRVIEIVSSTGATALVNVKRAAAGPAMGTLTIGALPGSQTEVKAGDTLAVTGTVDNTATYAEVVGSGVVAILSVLTLGAVDSGGAGKKTLSGNVVVGSGVGVQSITARAKNALGTFGANLVSSNTVVLNQTYPVIGAISIAYPNAQKSLKGSEVATVSATVTSYNTISYTSSTDLSVESQSAYAASKNVTRQNGGYVVANNYTITATKSSNGAVTVANAAVHIGNTAASAAVSIAGNPTRLISSELGQDYVVTVTPSQIETSAVSLNASSGTWQGAWAKSGNNWTRTLRIKDTDVDGAQVFTLSLTNAAGVVGTSITAGASYNVGGFVRKYITVPAFAREVAVGTSINNAAKTTAKYSGAGANLTMYADTGDHTQGYAFTDGAGNYSATGTHLFISDSAFAGANTSGTLILELEEVA